MSSAIKPPGAPGTGPTAPVSGTPGGPEQKETSAAGEAFREELSKAPEVGSTEAPRASSATASNASLGRADLLRALADELRSGSVDPQQAVDRLIERALHTGPAAALPPARRAELEALLRTALAEDPTLAAMQRDLSRGR